MTQLCPQCGSAPGIVGVVFRSHILGPPTYDLCEGTGQRAALAEAPSPADAMRALARALADSESAAEHFTCSEADAVAMGLALNGHRDQAVSWLSAHAWCDEDEWDQHRGLLDGDDDRTQPGDWRERADAYLRALLGED